MPKLAVNAVLQPEFPIKTKNINRILVERFERCYIAVDQFTGRGNLPKLAVNAVLQPQLSV